jgi:hypothetical protein
VRFVRAVSREPRQSQLKKPDRPGSSSPPLPCVPESGKRNAASPYPWKLFSLDRESLGGLGGTSATTQAQTTPANSATNLSISSCVL